MLVIPPAHRRSHWYCGYNRAGGFTVVNVTHDGNDGRTRRLVGRIIFFVILFQFCCIIYPDEFNFIANPPATSSITSASRRWLIDTMIPRLIHFEITSAKLTSIRLASLAYGNEFGYLQFVAFGARFSHMFGHLFAFGLAVFGFEAFAPSAGTGQFGLGLFQFSWISLASITLSSLRQEPGQAC